MSKMPKLLIHIHPWNGCGACAHEAREVVRLRRELVETQARLANLTADLAALLREVEEAMKEEPHAES